MDLSFSEETEARFFDDGEVLRQGRGIAEDRFRGRMVRPSQLVPIRAMGTGCEGSY